MFRMIEVAALPNGAHDNQESSIPLPLPEGWAEIPEGMELPETFPFVQVEAENGVVTALLPGAVPEEEVTPAARRKNAYETVAAVSYEGEMLTVDEANKRFLEYFAEGDSGKSQALQEQIAQAKGSIRETYPDEAGTK